MSLVFGVGLVFVEGEVEAAGLFVWFEGTIVVDLWGCVVVVFGVVLVLI